MSKKDNPCGAILKVGDDFGDNSCTFRCQYKKGHPGQHKETFKEGEAVMIWVGDDRITCDNCGRKTEEYTCCRSLIDSCPNLGKTFCCDCVTIINPDSDENFWACCKECENKMMENTVF